MDRGEVGSAASGTPDLADERLTEAVLASFDGGRSPRLREVMQSLTRHLHAFVSEVELTEEEWFLAIDFLARTGHMSDYRRQEFILLSDTLGVSMLFVEVNNRKPPGTTQATVFGPFFVEGAPFFENGDDLANGAPGEPCFVEGQVRSLSGEPIGDAHLAVWQADENGFSYVQYEGLSEARGQLRTDGEGRFHIRTVRPEPYPIPGYGPVTTHLFEAGDEYLDSDAVFGVKETLIADFVRHEPGTAPDGTGMDVPYHTVRYDFVLTPSPESGDPQGARTHEQAWEGWQDGRSGKGRDDARG